MVWNYQNVLQVQNDPYTLNTFPPHARHLMLGFDTSAVHVSSLEEKPKHVSSLEEKLKHVSQSDEIRL